MVWAPWQEERPRIQARVIRPDRETHEVDAATIGESPVPASAPNVLTDLRVLRVPFPAMQVGAIVEQGEVNDAQNALVTSVDWRVAPALGRDEKFVIGRIAEEFELLAVARAACTELLEGDSVLGDPHKSLIRSRLTFVSARLGNWWKAQGEYEKALAEYTESLRLKPDFGGAFVSRALVRQASRDYGRAIEDLTAAVKLNESHEALARNNLAWLLATYPDANHQDGRRQWTRGAEPVNSPIGRSHPSPTRWLQHTLSWPISIRLSRCKRKPSSWIRTRN